MSTTATSNVSAYTQSVTNISAYNDGRASYSTGKFSQIKNSISSTT